MFRCVRRFRVLAAVGLVLALAQGRARGQEPVWTTVADAVRRIRALPCITTHEEKPAAEQHTPLFAWEKKDAAERNFALGNCLEILGDRSWAYIRYQALSRRCPSQRAFAAAVERVTVKKCAPTGFSIEDLVPCCSWFAEPDSTALVLPERKDMLPDTERTQVLVELGVIANSGELLRTSYSTIYYGLGGFIDSD